MSIKIYDGFKLPEMSSFELLNFCHKFRDDVVEMLEIRTHQYVATQSCKFIDRNQFNLHQLTNEEFERLLKYYDAKINPISLSMDRLRDDLRLDIQDRKIYPDIFHCNISIHPLEDKTLIMLFADPEYATILKNYPEIEEYGYWNNCDKPDKCSEEEWQQRKQDWDDALNNFGVPREEGFVFDPICHLPRIDDEILLDSDPGVEARSKSIVRDLMYKVYFDNLYPDPNEHKNLRPSDYVSCYNDFVDEIIEGNLQQEYADKMQEVQQQLIPFSIEMVRQQYSISQELIDKRAENGN